MNKLQKIYLGVIAYMLVATIGNLCVGHRASAVLFTVLALPFAIGYWVEAGLKHRDKQYPEWDADDIFDWEQEED